MEAFNSLLGSLLGGAKGPLGIMGMINQYSMAAKEKKAMDQAMWYSKHPEAINALAAKFEKPLDAGLTTGVGNIVNASMAEQGLSQAPGIQSQVLAQAFAPYKQNAQQMAIAEAFKALGLPMEALSAVQSVQGGTDLASMLKGILPTTATPTGGGGGTTDPGLIISQADTGSMW
jgi:hypothetical protein